MRVRSPRRVIPAVRRRVTSKTRVHLLHIPKTGGSALKTALERSEFDGRYHLLVHGHSFRLSDVPEGEKFFFAVRDPATRFLSAFGSRQRQGRPGDPRPWRPEEMPVYQRFSTANDLAVALFSSDGEERATAQTAMAALRPFWSFWHWFGDEDRLTRRHDDLLMILFQERLDADFQTLTRRLELTTSLPTDDVGANRNQTPSSLARLSDRAIDNLRVWYRRDYEFLELCRHLTSKSFLRESTP
jgi:hypothetical protein